MRRLAPSFVALGLVFAPGAAGSADIGEGPVLVPADGGAAVLPPTQGCRILLAAGDGDCGVLAAAAGTLLFTIEAGPRIDEVLVSRPWTVRVYRPDDAVRDGWVIALTTPPAGDDAGPSFANVTAVITDVTGDGADELVIGYRSEGTGGFLDFEVVGTGQDGAPQVLLHERLAKGVVAVEPGRLVTYGAEYRRRDPTCCPTWIRRSATRFVDGELRLGPGSRLRTRDAEIPPGELG